MDQATLIERAEKLLPELSERAPETVSTFSCASMLSSFCEKPATAMVMR